jgi:hypothetical protein
MQTQAATFGQSLGMFFTECALPNFDNLHRVMKEKTVREQVELKVEILGNQVTDLKNSVCAAAENAAESTRQALVNAYEATGEFFRMAGPAIKEHPILLVTVPCRVVQNTVFGAIDAVAWVLDFPITGIVHALGKANIGPCAQSRVDVWVANQMQFVADYHTLDKQYGETKPGLKVEPRAEETLKQYTRRRHAMVRLLAGSTTAALASTLDFSKLAESDEKMSAAMKSVNDTIDEINSAKLDVTLAVVSAERARLRLESKFNTAFQVIKQVVVYNPAWENGTDYFDNLPKDELLRTAMNIGDVAKCIDSHGRHMLIKQTPLGLVVVFERYTPTADRQVYAFNADERIQAIDGGVSSLDAWTSLAYFEGLFGFLLH